MRFWMKLLWMNLNEQWANFDNYVKRNQTNMWYEKTDPQRLNIDFLRVQ